MSRTGSVHERAAGEFARAVEERWPSAVTDVLLFGSAARGDERGVESDVDVLVLTEGTDTPGVAEIHEVAYDVGLEHGVTMSVHVRTTTEYEAADSAFVRNVRTEAVTVADS